MTPVCKKGRTYRNIDKTSKREEIKANPSGTADVDASQIKNQ